MKDRTKKILEFATFISIASLPFIVATNILGVDTFLDSFENPDSYVYLKDSESISGVKTSQQGYIIIQKIEHPSFSINEKDTVLYFNFEGFLECNKINEVKGVGTFARYYMGESSSSEEPVFKNQIVGKVIKVLDENILTYFSLRIWDISISNLNIDSVL